MIRRGILNDLDACVALTSEFFAPFLATHGVKVRELDVRKVAFHAIHTNQLLVVEHDGKVEGITSWMVIPHPANNDLKIFYETIWCVKSKFKTDVLLLLRALEKEAMLANADLMLMANLNDIHEEQLKRIFTKRGFSFLETHYGKQIKGV